MCVEIRMYAGFTGQAGRLSAVRHELEALVQPIRVLRRCLLLETSEGLAIVIEADDRAACVECAHRVDRWMRERMPALEGYQPLTAAGEVIAEASGGNTKTGSGVS